MASGRCRNGVGRKDKWGNMEKLVTRDRVLIGVVCALVLLLLIPTQKDKEDAVDIPEPDRAGITVHKSPEAEPIPPMQAIIDNSPIKKAKAAKDAIEKRYERMEKIAEDPERLLQVSEPTGAAHLEGPRPTPRLVGDEHPLLPLVPGSSWKYEVSGDTRIIPASTWSMRVIKAPTDDNPGLLEVGFGDAVTPVQIVRRGDSFLLDWLPFVEPLQYLNNRPVEVAGIFLGAPAQIIDGSVWALEYGRHIFYEYRPKDEDSYRRVALAKQRDRAVVRPQQKILALTSSQDAYVIEWSSLFEISVDGRVVLSKLTTEPYRSEKMWLVPNIGIARREIHYGQGMDTKVIFDLVDYTK